MSKAALPPPPSIALAKPLSHWIRLADDIASGTVSRRSQPQTVEDDDTPANNYGMRAKATRDPGTRNESDPDRFQIRLEGLVVR